jgi:hypothetical protein
VLLDQQPGQFPPDVHGTLLTLTEGDKVLLLILRKHPLKSLLGTLHPLAMQTRQIAAGGVVWQRHPWLLSSFPR